MNLSIEIEKAILLVLPDAKIMVNDPDGQHFQAVVISESFRGLSLVKQHQIVMNALRAHLESNVVHALALKTGIPD